MTSLSPTGPTPAMCRCRPVASALKIMLNTSFAFADEMGPGAHVLAVCQPCVQALAAVAVMSEDQHPATPRTMTLMAGPIDPRESPTAVNRLAMEKPLSWFERNVTARVPTRYRGGGRRVYPGFVQLSAFVAMNSERHRARSIRSSTIIWPQARQPKRRRSKISMTNILLCSI